MKTPDPSLSLVIACLLSASFASAGEIQPSRLLSEDQIHDQIGAVTPKLAVSERQLDPFGQLQNIEAATSDRSDVVIGRPGPKPLLPFADIVDTIQIVGVEPKHGRVMAGGRPYRVGQTMRVPFKGKLHEVEVMGVAADKVEFKNVKTGETASALFKGAIGSPLQKDDW